MSKRITKQLNKSEETPAGYQRVTIPDQAIYYVVANYLQEQARTSGVSVLVGVSTETVQEVLRLFIEWASLNNLVSDGVLTLDSNKLED